MPQDLISRVDELWKELKIPVCMAAYVGEKYEEQDERILVIGESMYVEHEIKPDQFYGNENDLSAGEQQLLNYRAAVKLRKSRFFRNIERSLNKAGYSMDDVAMFNFFQRPTSDHALVHSVINQKDIEIGVKTCHKAIELLRPTKVIVMSKKIVTLLEMHHSQYFSDEFWTFAGNAYFKYIWVSHPSSFLWNKLQPGQLYSSRENFENFIMHGQDRFRLLSEQFESAIGRRDLDELIRLAKDFQAEVVFMDKKRKGKCGVVKTKEDEEKYFINCKKARVAKKANKVCGIVTELLQKCFSDIKQVQETVVPSLDNRHQEEIKMEMTIRRKMACKDAEVEITKFKEEFVQDDVVKEQLEKGLNLITNVLNTQLNAIDALIASI